MCRWLSSSFGSAGVPPACGPEARGPEVWFIAFRNAPSQLGGGLDEIARNLLHPGDDLGLVAGPAAQQQRNLLDAGVAVAPEVVRGDRSGIGRDSEGDVGAAAPIGPKQLLDPPDLGDGLGRRHLEPEPAVAILGNPPQRRIALATEPHRY